MRNQKVHVLISPLYFDKVFEPQRKNMEKKLGIKLSQLRFTEILAKKNLGIKQPVNNLKSLPKQFKRRSKWNG